MNSIIARGPDSQLSASLMTDNPYPFPVPGTGSISKGGSRLPAIFSYQQPVKECVGQGHS